MICEKYFNYFKSLNLMIIFNTKFEYKYNILKSTQPHIMHLFFHIDVHYRKKILLF